MGKVDNAIKRLKEDKDEINDLILVYSKYSDKENEVKYTAVGYGQPHSLIGLLAVGKERIVSVET